MTTKNANKEKIQPRRYKTGDRAGQRRLHKSRQDPVSEELANCNGVDEIAALAVKFGITDEEIRSRMSHAPNFGQFRMVVGNRLRSVVKRIEAAEKAGMTLSASDAAYPKEAKARAKKAKAEKKSPAKKKVAAKKAKAEKKSPPKKK